MSWRARSQIIKTLRQASAAGIAERRAYSLAAIASATPVDPTLAVPGPSNWYKRAQQDKAPAEETTQASSGSEQSNATPITLPFSISRIPPTEHEATRKLWYQFTLPRTLRRRRNGVEWHDAVWLRFRALSAFARAQLPVPVLRMILHHVVPDKPFVQKWLAGEVKGVKPDRRENVNVVTYPWEGRLQAVVASMLASEGRDGAFMDSEREMMLAHAEETAELGTDLHVTVKDYAFVLERFAIAGHLTGAESVVKEMQARGIDLTHAINETRLRTLSKWITIRATTHRKHLTYDQKNLLEQYGYTAHSYGALVKIARDLPVSVPNDVAALLKDLLQSLLTSETLALRRLSLDLLLRIAKETGNTDAMGKILLSGYGFDLRYPERGALNTGAGRESMTDVLENMDMLKGAGKSWKERAAQRATGTSGAGQEQAVATISTHALNTIIEGLGEKGQVWKMLTVLEVLADGSNSAERPFGRVDAKGEEDTTARAKLSEEFFSAAEPPEEPPLTLSEATRREERSGDRINFFGKRVTPTAVAPELAFSDQVEQSLTYPPTDSQPLEVSSPVFGRFNDFITAPPPLSEMIADGKKWAEQGRPLDLGTGRYNRSNSATFAAAMRYAAVYAASINASRSIGDRIAELDLGIYLARRALLQQLEERGRFLRDWVWIREAAKLAIDKLPLDVETGKPADVDAIARVRDWTVTMRKQITPPAISLSAPAIAPLFSAMYMSGTRGVRHTRAEQVLEIARSASRQLREELFELVGNRGNVEDVELLAGYRDFSSLEESNAPPESSPESMPRPAKQAQKKVDTSLDPNQLCLLDVITSSKEFQLGDHLRALRTILRELKEKITVEEARLERSFERKAERLAKASRARVTEREQAAQALAAEYMSKRAADEARARQTAEEAEDQTMVSGVSMA